MKRSSEDIASFREQLRRFEREQEALPSTPPTSLEVPLWTPPHGGAAPAAAVDVREPSQRAAPLSAALEPPSDGDPHPWRPRGHTVCQAPHGYASDGIPTTPPVPPRLDGRGLPDGVPRIWAPADDLPPDHLASPPRVAPRVPSTADLACSESLAMLREELRRLEHARESAPPPGIHHRAREGHEDSGSGATGATVGVGAAPQAVKATVFRNRRDASPPSEHGSRARIDSPPGLGPITSRGVRVVSGEGARATTATDPDEPWLRRRDPDAMARAEEGPWLRRRVADAVDHESATSGSAEAAHQVSREPPEVTAGGMQYDGQRGTLPAVPSVQIEDGVRGTLWDGSEARRPAEGNHQTVCEPPELTAGGPLRNSERDSHSARSFSAVADDVRLKLESPEDPQQHDFGPARGNCPDVEGVQPYDDLPQLPRHTDGDAALAHQREKEHSHEDATANKLAELQVQVARLTEELHEARKRGAEEASRARSAEIRCNAMHAEQEAAWSAARQAEAAAAGAMDEARAATRASQDTLGKAKAALQALLAAEGVSGGPRSPNLKSPASPSSPRSPRLGEETVPRSPRRAIDENDDTSVPSLVAAVAEVCGSLRAELRVVTARVTAPVRAAKTLVATGAKLLRLQQAQRALNGGLNGGCGGPLHGHTARDGHSARAPLYSLPSSRRGMGKAGDDIASQLVAEMGQALRELEDATSVAAWSPQ